MVAYLARAASRAIAASGIGSRGARRRPAVSTSTSQPALAHAPGHTCNLRLYTRAHTRAPASKRGAVQRVKPTAVKCTLHTHHLTSRDPAPPHAAPPRVNNTTSSTSSSHGEEGGAIGLHIARADGGHLVRRRLAIGLAARRVAHLLGL